MKMLFDADEMVTVREGLCETWKIKKQELADCLVGDAVLYALEIVLERAIILSNLTNIISIEITGNIIELKPIGIKMRVSDTIIYYLHALKVE